MRLSAATLLPLLLIAFAGQPPRVGDWRCDFTVPDAPTRWNLQGRISAERVTLGTAGNQVQAIRIAAESGAGLVSKPGLLPAALDRFESIDFQVFRKEADAKTPLALDVLFLEENPRVFRQRRFVLEGAGWQTVRVPLCWFHPGPVGVAAWPEIRRLALVCRSGGSFWLANLGLTAGTREHPTEPSGDELAKFAFADQSKVRRLETPRARLLTNAPQLELARLAAHLDRVHAAFFRRLPFLQPPAAPPWLLVFAQTSEFRSFVVRFAEQHGATARPPTTAGFTMMGTALSTWDERHGSLRSVYTHEYIHALLEASARLPNTGDWVQEGLATLFQAEFHPDFRLAEMVRGQWQRQRPLAELCDGKPPRLEDYWQAASLWHCLASEPKYQPALPKLLAALRTSESSRLEPHLRPVLGTSWEALTRDWTLHCRREFGVP